MNPITYLITILTLILGFGYRSGAQITFNKADTLYINQEADLFRDFNEPARLYEYPQNHEVYRFLCLRSLRDPVLVKLEKLENGYTLYWKEFSIKDQKLCIDKKKQIDKATWDQFAARLDRIHFIRVNTVFEGDPVFDGAYWILEAKTDKSYHVVERYSPAHGNPYYNCCVFLIKLTDLNLPEAK